MKKLNHEFGIYVKISRVTRGISQKKLSKLTGIDEANLSRIEQGKTDPRLSTCIKIINILKQNP